MKGQFTAGGVDRKGGAAPASSSSATARSPQRVGRRVRTEKRCHMGSRTLEGASEGRL